MSMASVDRDPSTVDDASAKAGLGSLYYWGGSTGAPEGIYRYVKFADSVTYVNGHACLYDDTSWTVTNDISSALGGTDSAAFAGVCVRANTTAQYGYILVSGKHTNLKGDYSVGVGEPIFCAGDGAFDSFSGSTASRPAGYALSDDNSLGIFTGMICAL